MKPFYFRENLPSLESCIKLYDSGYSIPSFFAWYGYPIDDNNHAQRYWELDEYEPYHIPNNEILENKHFSYAPLIYNAPSLQEILKILTSYEGSCLTLEYLHAIDSWTIGDYVDSSKIKYIETTNKSAVEAALELYCRLQDLRKNNENIDYII